MRLAPVLLLLLSATAVAQPPAPAEALPPPTMATPPAGAAPEQQPPADNGAEVIEPQVTITHRDEDVIEEYRIGGRRYMVKITPRKGYPYYLIDTDGDGSFETRRSELSNPPIPQWVLFRW